MKLLPHSNGVRKVNMKKKRTPQEKFKLIIVILGILFIIGFTFQRVSNFVAKETLKQKVDYTTVDDRRMDYRLKGQGEYTVVFDGSLGTNLEAWTPAVEMLEEEDVYTFVYNRRGYGYSDSGPRRTPAEQAQDLKILLRKSGAPEPYILVGEEYGSLVLTSFAEQFPEAVAGIVLVDPIIESEIGTKEYKRNNFFTRIRRKVEDIGSGIGVTTLLNKLNLDVKIDDFESMLSEESLEEFTKHRTKSGYSSAVYNELTNLLDGNSKSQKAGIFSGKPYYLVLRQENEMLKSLGDEALTKVNITISEKEFLSLNATDNIVTGIKNVIKQLQDINRRR